MSYILVINNSIEAIFESETEVPDDLKTSVTIVDNLPELICQPGKEPYYYWNGSSVEVRYDDRPINIIEQMQVNQACIIYQLMMSGVI